MNSSELKEAFAKRLPILERYGSWVTHRVVAEVQKRLGASYSKSLFKTTPEHRVKDLDGFLEKAARKGKTYSAPLEEITDQVGTRFVVLLERECELINEAIQSVQEWVCERAKDVEQLREAQPHHFDYESHHWVVRPKAVLQLGEILVPTNFACEIQVRTLLQHAYAELAHATVYKPKTSAETKIKRIIARGAALIETTGGVFTEVDKLISASSAKLDGVLKSCCVWYSTNVSPCECTPSKLALRIADAYADLLRKTEWRQIEEYLKAANWLPNEIRENLDKPLFGDPAILLVFWLVSDLEETIFTDWPLDSGYLEPVFAKLGISSSGF